MGILTSIGGTMWDGWGDEAAKLAVGFKIIHVDTPGLTEAKA